MLAIFRTNQMLANVLLIAYAAILHLSLFFVASDWTAKGSSFLSAWWYYFVEPNGALSAVVAILLVAFQGTFINYLVTEYRMANEISLFPGVFYILVTSLIPDFLHLSPVLIGNTFLILALHQLMETYKKYSCANNVYNIGLWIGVASLFYASFSIFILLAWIGLNILRAFKLEERFMLLIGFFTPFLFVFTYYYWVGETNYFWSELAAQFKFWDLMNTDSVTLYTGLGSMFFLLVIVILNARNYGLRKNIRVQKNINILYTCLFMALFSLFFQAQIGIEHLLVMAVPIGIFISFNFTNMSNQAAESIHLVLLVVILVWQYAGFLPQIG